MNAKQYREQRDARKTRALIAEARLGIVASSDDFCCDRCGALYAASDLGKECGHVLADGTLCAGEVIPRV